MSPSPVVAACRRRRLSQRVAASCRSASPSPVVSNAVSLLLFGQHPAARSRRFANGVAYVENSRSPSHTTPQSTRRRPCKPRLGRNSSARSANCGCPSRTVVALPSKLVARLKSLLRQHARDRQRRESKFVRRKYHASGHVTLMPTYLIKFLDESHRLPREIFRLRAD